MSPLDSARQANAQKRVLIVDDVEDNRIVLERGLKSCGYATESCDSGRTALSLISLRLPDIILLDWMMPDLSGLDTLLAIRELYDSARLPVIMCTAMDEEMSVVAAINAGANDYMVKPISLPILRARMKVHLEQRALVDTLDTQKNLAEQRLTDRTRAMFDQIPTHSPSSSPYVARGGRFGRE
jgi:DNA-binding response OmpR family regulator